MRSICRCSRSITVITGVRRTSRERSVMAKRAAFGVALIGVTPTTDTTPATSGSLRIVASTSARSRCISANDTSSPPSITAKIRPVSCCGRKPFGITR